MVASVLPMTTTGVIVVTLIGGGMLYATIPLFYELAVETAYPVGEGSVSFLIVLLQNLMQSIFLFLPVSRLGTGWMVWSIVGVILFSILIMLIFFVEEKRRTREDLQVDP